MLRRFKNNEFWCRRRRRKQRHTEKVWRRGIKGIISWRLMSGTCWTFRIICSWSHNRLRTFETFKSFRLHEKDVSAIRVEAERCRTEVLARVNGCLNSRKWCPWCNGYRHRSWTRQVQILDETDCISNSTNTLGKGMNPIILPPAMGK